jgi:hypothetical protein
MAVQEAFQGERAELAKVIASDTFARAPGLASILSYVCEQYFRGESAQIKEYNIAVEALGRPASFNQKQDSIVRVEIHHLRKRLRQYYDTLGSHDQYLIEIPQGQYVPHFIPNPAFSPDHQTTTEQTQTAALVDGPAQDLSVSLPALKVRPEARRKVGLIAGLCVALVVAGVAGVLLWRSALARATSAEIRTSGDVVAGGSGLPEGEEIRILCGSKISKQVDHQGGVWGADRYFTGGSSTEIAHQRIVDGHGPGVFRSQRDGNFRYDIPLKPGVYELHLFFAETNYGEGNPGGGGETSRIFQVEANGKMLLSDMDVIADAGASNLLDERVFKDIQPAADGFLHLVFTSRKDVAILNAIEVLPGIAGKTRPVRIVARDTPYTDRAGKLWGVDRYVRGGQSIVRPETVKDALDSELYRGERFGNMVYTIPVAPGTYKVTMHFADFWFGQDRPGGGGVGSRVFDVVSHGTVLWRRLDVLKEAGCCYKPLVKVYRGLQPNPQGKLVLSFIPEVNYAFINAIEVEDESD